MVLSVTNYKKEFLGINFQLHTHTSVAQKNCFRIICVIILGLIVNWGVNCQKTLALQHFSPPKFGRYGLSGKGVLRRGLLKTTPHPNKNGSYGVKVGVRMEGRSTPSQEYDPNGGNMPDMV